MVVAVGIHEADALQVRKVWLRVLVEAGKDTRQPRGPGDCLWFARHVLGAKAREGGERKGENGEGAVTQSRMGVYRTPAGVYWNI